MMELSQRALLEFVSECDLSEAEDQQLLLLPQVACHAPLRIKQRPRRDALEISALRAQAGILNMELNQLKAARANTKVALVAGPSHWQTEAQRQSRRRAEAQVENERLKAQVRAKAQTAKRLKNVFRRSSTSQILKMLHRYDWNARLRLEKAQDDLDADIKHAYHQTDAIFAEAEMANLPSVFFGSRMHRKTESAGLTIEFRRCVVVPRSSAVANEAYWEFTPHKRFSDQFVLEHTSNILDHSMDTTFLFRKRSSPSTFSGRFQLARYATDDRVVVVWKSLMYSPPYDVSPQVRLRGRGWVVIKSASSEHSSTSIQTFARYYPESDVADDWTPEQAQQDANIRILIEFVTCAMEGYSELTTHRSLLQ